MKKFILSVATVTLAFGAIAQDKYVTSALISLNQKNLEEAKKDIDKAMSSPETSEKPKALNAKAQIYFSMQLDEKYKASNPYRESLKAALKLAELKPEYEKETINQILYYCAAWYYNDGTNAYNSKKYAEAAEFLPNTLKVQKVNGGKRFEKTQFGKNLDTIAANAELTLARVAYYSNNIEEAIRLISTANKNPIIKSADNYIILLESYDKYNTANNNKMAADEQAAIQEARAAYPDNINIRNMEMNSYFKNGKMNELITKLETEIAKDPNNADLNFNLALLYQGQANPKEGAKPANAAEYYGKADLAFQKAVKGAPENANYNYNYGALYYMQAYDYNAKMNEITGSSSAELKKYDELKLKRDAYFEKAVPNLEKAINVLSAREGNLGDNEKEIYRATLTALMQIYGVQNKTEKITEAKKKMENLK